MNRTAAWCSLTAVLALVALLPSREKISVSAAGLQLIAELEGCQQQSYQCSARVWTSGIGHTKTSGPNERKTKMQIARNFLADMHAVNTALRRCLPPLPQVFFDTAASLAFNVGSRAVCASTFAARLRQKNYRAACSQLARWVYAGGKKNSGLVRRRKIEKAYCLAGLK